MTRRLEGRSAIVTGAARGIGRATAERFAQEGARVLLTDWSDRRGAEAAEQLSAEGHEVAFQRHDAGDAASWAAVVDRAVELFGGLNILVNNAYSGVARSVEALTPEDLRDAMRVNLEGSLIGTTLAARAMRAGGSIVNVSSVAAFDGAPENASYAAAKLALLSLTKSAAIRYAAQDPPVRVNAVAPGMTRTPTLESTVRAVRALPKAADIDDVLSDLARRIPLRRAAEPRELANAILFLASEEASYITGECLVVDGGHMAGRG